MKRHRDCSVEEKRTAVARVVSGESVAQVARDLKVDRRRVHEWYGRYRAGGMEAVRGVGRPRNGSARAWEAGEDALSRAKRQIAALQCKIGEQQVDLDFFRRALRQVQQRRSAKAMPGGTPSTKSSRR